MPIRNWGEALNQFAVIYGDRVPYDILRFPQKNYRLGIATISMKNKRYPISMNFRHYLDTLMAL
jgi:hypothetical protein